MQVSEHFELIEFIDPVTYSNFADNSIWFIDQRLINVAEAFRVIVNKPVIINDWHIHGKYKESGLRTFNTTTGSKYSQHRYGRAADLKVKGMTGQQLFNVAKANWDMLKEFGLTTVENPQATPTWLHCDTRQWQDTTELHIVNP